MQREDELLTTGDTDFKAHQSWHICKKADPTLLSRPRSAIVILQ
jgi:hypothetical protein